MPKADTPPGFKPLKDTALFKPFKLGPLNLEHRIVQAPLTRMRAVKESDAVFVPKELHVEYYGQRATKGGLQLTEATDIAKYVRSDETNKQRFTDMARPADTQAYQASSQTRSSRAGRRSLMPSTQRADTSSASSGTPAAPHHPPSALAHPPSAPATSPWKEAGSTARNAPTTHRTR